MESEWRERNGENRKGVGLNIAFFERGIDPVL